MQTQNKENLLIAAGFKVITPHAAAQRQKLQALPPDHVTLVQKDGKTYYVFPDAANNQAYVGGPKQYQAYRQLRLANKLGKPAPIRIERFVEKQFRTPLRYEDLGPDNLGCTIFNSSGAVEAILGSRSDAMVQRIRIVNLAESESTCRWISHDGEPMKRG